MTKLMKRLALCLATMAAFALALVLCGTALAAETAPADRNQALEALDAALVESFPEEAREEETAPADLDALEASLDADGTEYYAFEALKDPGIPAPQLSSGARAADGSVTYSGTGAKTITGISLPAGAYYAEYRYTGSGNFISKLYYGSASYDYFSISNEIGTCHGVAPMYRNGNLAVSNGRLEVSRGSGSWTVTFRPVTGTTTTSLKGSGDTATGFFTARKTSYTVSGTHSGSGNFIVRIVRERDSGKSYLNSIGVFNEIGSCSGSKTVTLEAGVRYYIYVIAGGSWTLNFGQGDSVTDYTGWLSSSGGSSSGGSGGGDTPSGGGVREFIQYIKDHGEYKTSGGSAYYVWQAWEGPIGAQTLWGFQYTPDQDLLGFSVTEMNTPVPGGSSSARSDDTTVVVTMNAATQTCPKGTILVTRTAKNDAGRYVTAWYEAPFSFASYNGDKTPLNFRITQSGAPTPIPFNDYCNQYVQMAASMWEAKVKAAGFTMRGVGFASYGNPGPWEVRSYSGGRVEFYGPLESGAALYAAHYVNGKMTRAVKGSVSGSAVTFSGLTLAPGDRIFVVNPGTLTPRRGPVTLR